MREGLWGCSLALLTTLQKCAGIIPNVHECLECVSQNGCPAIMDGSRRDCRDEHHMVYLAWPDIETHFADSTARRDPNSAGGV